jgi:phage terminase small subunit
MADQDLVQTNTNKNGTGYSMGVPKKLTEKQMKFAHEIVTNEGRKTATECAVDAGFEPDFARQYASKLQNPKLYPLVVKYIGELREEWQKKYEVTYDRHISELGKIRQQALNKGAWSAAVNAEVARGKAAGLYIEQKIIRTGKLEDLTTEELELRMKQIIDDYSPILEGVPFEELKEKVKTDKELQTTEHQEEPPNESSLSSSHKKSEKQNAQKNE